MMLDLDYFKNVNDNYGHQTGDKLLQQASERMTDSLRQYDIVGRIGGDEFQIGMSDITDLKIVDEVANRLLEALSSTFYLDGHECQVSASIGISFSGENLNDIESLSKQADAALYKAKEKGRNCVVYSDQIHNE